MRHWWCGLPVWALSICGQAGSASAQALTPGPPGPYVIDVRGTTLGAPQAAAFYPVLPDLTEVPARAFGLEAGAHVYLGRLGPGHLGVGASVLQVRGTTGEGVSVTTRVLAPQVSFNFGTADGWSYVSGGVGAGQVRGRLDGAPAPTEGIRASGILTAVNVGGGARWFFSRHVAFGFDVRLHRLAAREARGDGFGTPPTWLGSASVGLSFK